jgi:hypothetical protein
MVDRPATVVVMGTRRESATAAAHGYRRRRGQLLPTPGNGENELDVLRTLIE